MLCVSALESFMNSRFTSSSNSTTPIPIMKKTAMLRSVPANDPKVAPNADTRVVY
ncbi:MAG: hypothetical protein Q8N79_06740 [Candidatus Methanoperedens sp.]|nr:hypothetical protein [Candidatus Methanoperedens sp.]